MMDLKKLAAPVALSLGLAACLAMGAAPAVAAPLKKPDVNLAIGGTSAQLYFLPIVLTQQLGFFEKEGLKVNIIDTGSGAKGLQALVSGGADVTAGSFEHPLRMQARGQDVVAIVKFGRFLGNVLAVTKKHMGKYKSADDLKGWTIGVSSPGSSTYMFVTVQLANKGLKADDASFIALGQGAGGLAAVRTGGQLDAISLTDPVISELESTGDIQVVADSRTLKGTEAVYGGETIAGVLYTTGGFIEKYPDTVQALANAVVRTLKWMKTATPEQIMAKVPESYIAGRPDFYKAVLLKNLEGFQTDGTFAVAPINTMMNYLRATDKEMHDAKFDPAKAYNNSFAEKANATIGK